MPRRVSSLATLCGFFLGAAACLCAQEIDVATVRFNNVRPPGGGAGNWLEADVALDVKPAPPARMISRVQVALTLAFELPAAAGAERRVEHYRATAECVALEPGRADVRFYLPPELVKRDQLHGEPKFWGVEIAVAGRALPAGHNSTSAALASAEARRNFAAHASTVAAANDGLLQPQYLTIFAAEYPRDTPTFVRRDSH